MKHQVLLYYKYVKIEGAPEMMEMQKHLCEELNLTGRIIVAEEGINGTVEGTVENTEKYVEKMHSHQKFSDMHFKRSPGTGEAFPRLSVKVRPEIVSSYLPKHGEDVNPNRVTGDYIYAEQLHEWYETGKEFYIVDMRNDYEHRSGHFEGSILAPFENFRDLPEVLEEISHLKDKNIVTVCTGGIRCEKASGFLKENGFNNVYQLYGGMHTYMEKYPDGHFQGKLFVFDNRMLVGFNMEDEAAADSSEEIVGRCDICNGPSENYINCSYLPCHRLTIACEDCIEEMGGVFCSTECQEKAAEHPHEVQVEITRKNQPKKEST